MAIFKRTYPSLPIMLVDDEETFLRTASLVLRSHGITHLESHSSPEAALVELRKKPFCLVLLDLHMPGMNGEKLLETLQTESPSTLIVVITGHNEVETAVRCMQKGAIDYLIKPLDENRLLTCVRRSLDRIELQNEAETLRAQMLDPELKAPEAFSGIVARSHRMYGLFQYLDAIAPTQHPILITGECGVGKDLMAQAAHKASRFPGPFISAHVAGLDDAQFTKLLFGETRLAQNQKEPLALIEKAAEGTLFINEIGELSPESQLKLLRLLQEGQYYPQGSDQICRSKARIICATQADLPGKVKAGQFRKDLYFRLKLHEVAIPSLSHRTEDIPALIEAFVKEAAAQIGKSEITVSREFRNELSQREFPGNVRELKGIIFDLVTSRPDGLLSVQLLRDWFMRHGGPGLSAQALANHGITESVAPELRFPIPLPTLEEVEDLLIHEALRLSHGNKTLAAQMIGVTRQTLNNRRRQRGQDEKESTLIPEAKV